MTIISKRMQLYVYLAVAAVTVVVQSQCPSEDELINKFNHISSEYELRDKEGQVCEIKECLHEDMYSHDDQEGHDDERHTMDQTSSNNSCETIYSVCRTVILDLHLTDEDCLIGHNSTADNKVSSAQAYGYGFLMVLGVSLCSLGGVFLVPLIISNSPTGKRIYEHVYSFMVAIAISALVSDAVLHLIPHALGLHDHEEDDDGGHGHGHGSSGGENLDFLWKECIVLAGLYGFYLLEFFLHTFGHDHNHNMWDGDKEGQAKCDGAHHNGSTDDSPAIPSSTDASNTTTEKSSLLKSEDSVEHKHPQSLCIHPRKLKPVAWLIIIGDSVHNIADGIALGAAISQSLSLGVSTMLAVAFHELPHELGDYVILVKSGFHWATALIVNFLQSLGAILGFFIGVAISTNSESTSNWILAFTAGLFFYIALTNLLPDLVHGGEHGPTKNERSCNWNWIIRFVLVNFGFYISFVVLLILAIYEEDLNELI